MSARQSRAQRMAQPALGCVKVVAASNLAKDYKPRAMGFPTMVLQSGLAQAVGFLAAKSSKDGKGKAYQQYFDDLAKVTGYPNSAALLQDALKADLPRYRLLTRDVLDAAVWLKRFCQSLIEEKEDSDGA